MVRLTLDRQNNKIVLSNPEAKNEIDLGMVSLSNCDLWSDFPDRYGTQITRAEFTEIDFEGLVLEIVDVNGNKWSTEIIGWTNG